MADAATDAALSYLQLGLPTDAVAALISMRLGLRLSPDRTRIAQEEAHCERVRAETAELAGLGTISSRAAAAIDDEYALRLAALREGHTPIPATTADHTPAVDDLDERASAWRVSSKEGRGAAGSQIPAAAAPATEEQLPSPTPPIPPEALPPGPAAPAFSLRDLFAEHSAVILASLGGFLLVVATVLFELYGTTGLGGGVRLAAVVVLNLIFAVAGYFAIGQERLRMVGHIYIALAAVLMPLVGIAAWTFLELGARGITVDQALAVTGGACALVYGNLAYRLALRPYAAMAGLAVFAATWGLSKSVGGDQWLSAGLAVAPLSYAVWARLVPARVFSDFQWFAHAAALVAVAAAARYSPSDWIWTITLGTVAIVYLVWQALAPHRSRAWTAEVAIVLASAAAIGPLGVNSFHFMLPMLAGIALIVLTRIPHRLGLVGRLYRAHPAHLHLAVLTGVAFATAEYALGSAWALSLSLWLALLLYLVDFALQPTVMTGYTLRGALPLALAATGRADGLGPWTAALVAVASLAYVLPYIRASSLAPLRTYAEAYFYGILVLVAIELYGANIGLGHWEIPTALMVSAAVLAIASELQAVRFSALAARGLFSVAWLTGVEAVGAQGWRGPLDALLALFYTALGRIRAVAHHALGTAGRRELVHAAALLSLVLCFFGPGDLLWWRLAAALGLLAVAYWWLAVTAAEVELPWLAWTAISAAAGCLAVAALPERWQGVAITACALALTGVWAAARRLIQRPAFDHSGLPVLAILAGFGTVSTLRELPPQSSQALVLVLFGAVLAGWSLLVTEPLELRHVLRTASAALVSVGLLLGAAVLGWDMAAAGGLALAIGAAHSEWSVRARNGIERWYALVALLLMTPVILFWPYANNLPGLVGAEFLALAGLAAATGVRRRLWAMAYAAVLLLVPAMHFALVAAGLSRNAETEEVAMAALAWAAGVAGLILHKRFAPNWARAIEIGAVTIATAALVALASGGVADAAGIAMLAYAAIVYTAGMQERERWVLPAAVALALAGSFTLLGTHNADTLIYAAALGVLGLLVWLAAPLILISLGRHPVVDMHRYLGLGLLVVAAVAGFVFPDRTGAGSFGAGLAALALVVTGGVLWGDARTFGSRLNLYLAVVSATSAGYFLAREVGLPSWELVSPGLGVIACGIRLRGDREFLVELTLRQMIVAVGLVLVMGWAAAKTLTGDPSWLVALLIEGAIAVMSGIVLRSRVLLAGGGAALAVVSLRALWMVAEAGYLFLAFGAVALVLIVVGTALALGRDHFRPGTFNLREQLAHWD